MTAAQDEAAILRKGIEDFLEALDNCNQSIAADAAQRNEPCADLHTWWAATRDQADWLRSVLAQADAVKQEVEP